jgi:hypothetical protein
MNRGITGDKLKPAGTDSTDSEVVASAINPNANTSASESPVLQAAARKGRTAMALLKMPSIYLENRVHYEESRCQSLKQATKSLLCATKATALLAESITEIRKRHISSRGEKTNDPAGVCLLELHKTFLNLAQDLLNCVDPAGTPGPRSSPKVPPDDQLIDLLLKLSYRAHQLSLSFTWSLYQRLVITVAKQPQLSTVRSRAKWIWCIYQWYQTSWGTNANIVQSVTADAVDIDWFRPSLLELAKHQHWSDLGYLLRQILDPPMTGTVNDRVSSRRSCRRKNSTYTSIALPQDVHESAYVEKACLAEDLVRELLLALHYHKVLPSLWKNLKNPSVVEKDVLEILFLLERSIWNLFDYETGTGSDTLSQQSGTGKPGEKPKPSLRDAIDVLLQSSFRNNELDIASARQVSKQDVQELLSQYDAEHDETIQLLLDFKEILDEANDIKDDSYDDEPAEVEMLLDHFIPRGSRKLETRSRRRGDHNLLEVTGVGNAATLKSSSSSNLVDPQIKDEATDIIYSREVGYYDDIPDIAFQIYQHNGNRVLRYRYDLEDEIHESLQESDTDEWNETDFDDESLSSS